MDDWQIAIHGKWVIRLEMGAGIRTKATSHPGANTTCTSNLGIYGRGYQETVLIGINEIVHNDWGFGNKDGRRAYDWA